MFGDTNNNLQARRSQHLILRSSLILTTHGLAGGAVWRTLLAVAPLRAGGEAETGSYGEAVGKHSPKPAPGDRLPPAGPDHRLQSAPGGTRPPHRPDEFWPAIPRSGWSPPEPVSASPARAEYHALCRTTGQRGHFYFARKGTFLLCLDSDDFGLVSSTMPWYY